jgi:hypothetical protein
MSHRFAVSSRGFACLLAALIVAVVCSRVSIVGQAGDKSPNITCKEGLDAAAYRVGRAGSAGQVVVRHHHATRTASYSGRERDAERWGSRRARRRRQNERRSARRRRRRRSRPCLQRTLVRPREVDRPHVAHRRSAGWPAAAADGGRPRATGGEGRAAGRTRVRLVGEPASAGTLHHVSRRAAAAVRLQQPYQIFQTPGSVVIPTRTFTTSGRQSTAVRISGEPQAVERQPVGRWDGNTLVVETTSYARRRPDFCRGRVGARDRQFTRAG